MSIDSITVKLYITVMLLNSDDLSIQDLAAATKLSVRTIRFYQREGLMDSPGLRGVKVLYGDSDVQRLELIRALQKERMTLAEIRDRLAPMDEAEVARTLAELQQRRSSAADYARSVRMAAEREPAPYFRAERTPQRPAAAPSRRSRATWERISITPNLELHVRSPLSHRETMLVSRLVELADRLMNTQEGV
jgi:DNA-binding transcriptional MerR regulator